MKPPRWSVMLVLLGALALAFGVATLDAFPIGAAVDDAMYVILGKSIAFGHGYRSLNVPGAPPNTHFPPGYPAVLALIWRLAPDFPGNVVWFKAVNVVSFVVIAIGMARFAASLRIGRTWSLTMGVLAAISVPVLVLVALMLSEPLFLALIVFLLPALEQFVNAPEVESPTAARAVMLGVGIGLCTLVRSHGIVLIPAMMLILGAKRRWRDAGLVAGAAILCLLPWQVYSARHAGMVPAPLLGGYDSYTAWWIRGFREMGFAMVPRTLGRTIPEAAGMFAALFSPVRGAVAHGITIAALLVLAIAGYVSSWRRIPVTLLFLVAYLFIIAIWPFQPGRFIWGVWPLLLLVLLLGARAATGASSALSTPVRAVVLVCAAWAGIGYGMYEARAVKGRWWSTIPRNAAPHISFAVEWAQARTAPGDVIATEDEGPVFLYTGRQTVPVRALTTKQYLMDLSVEENAADGLVPVLAAYPVRAVIVYTRAAFDVARFLGDRSKPMLAPQGVFPGGGAFTVLRR